MDWTAVLLFGSHIATLCAGVALGRFLVVRNLEVRDHDGHLALEVRHCDDKPPPDDDD